MLFDRRRFLAAAAAGLAIPTLSRAATAKRLVVVFAEGGWDVSFCFDPKLHSAEVQGPEVDQNLSDPDDREALQTFGELTVLTNAVKRPSVGAYFEKWGDRTAIVNGIWMGAIAHATARVRVLTGTQNQLNPALAAIGGHVLGTDLPLGSIDLSGGSYSGYLAASTGQIGYQSQLQALVIDDASFPAPKGLGYRLPQFRLDEADRDLLSARLAHRVTAARERWGTSDENRAMLDARAEALIRSGRFRREGASTLAALDLGTAPTLEAQADLAVDFLQGDLCRAVTLDSRQYWDTHEGNETQHNSFEQTFSGVDHLVGRLSDAGLLDDTLVVVLSEFTRSPKLNTSLGKDHWPHASFLLVGGGVRGGRAYGGTDDRLESLPVDLRTGEVDERGLLNKYDNMSAGILTALDIDPAEWFPTIQPFTAPFV